ncbi:MAG: hypothetical protein NC543_10320 [bacterium]|nr:hypothetical protein [bacterium]MCM1374294.1 hypothetical protein [Muribaculum sp.]
MMDAMDMRQLLDSMENTIKLQGRARAEKRAREAEREQKEFKEKLMRIAASQVELEGMARKVKGTAAAVQRDQLIGLMGFY